MEDSRHDSELQTAERALLPVHRLKYSIFGLLVCEAPNSREALLDRSLGDWKFAFLRYSEGYESPGDGVKFCLS